MISAADPKSELTEIALGVDGMNCASCVSHVENAARTVDGVETASVNLATGRAVVQYNSGRTNPLQIAEAISKSGYPATPAAAAAQTTAATASHHHDRQRNKANSWFNRAVVGMVLWLPVEAIHWIRLAVGGHVHGLDWMIWLSLVTSTVAIGYVGWAFYRSAFAALLRRTSNMDTLIALGASVAYLYSLVALLGHLIAGWPLADLYFMESTGLLALISLGHWMEARVRQSAGSAIRDLLNLTPATALRIIDGAQQQVPVNELNVGDEILIRPGDRVPIDGVITEGRSSVDESMLTGEPLPVARGKGDLLIGGTQNLDGALHLRVSKIGSETALAQIVKLVEHAQSTKPAVQKLADRIAAVFVPSVLGIALLTGIGWYTWGQIHSWETAHTWAILAKSVCSVLIIACPCALGLAVPAALMVGTGRGAKRGILIRDIDGLQRAEKIDTVVLDKTGTITQGKPVVSSIESLNDFANDEILRLAGSAEQFSEHPLAKAIVAEAQKRGVRLVDPSGFNNIPGAGVVAEIEGKQIRVGGQSHVGDDDVSPTISAGTTLVHIAIDQKRVGVIHLSDQIKPDSTAAIAELHRMKLRTVLLSGDNDAAARQIARQVGITDVRANVKPADKAAAIRALQNPQSKIQNPKSNKIAMVGDGINDAPALAAADLGIAIGAGSDIAKESGDIVLVSGSLHGIAVAIRLSRATMRTIRQNLFLAFIYNVLAIPLAALGLLNPLIAAAAMALSDVTVIGNALLLRRADID